MKSLVAVVSSITRIAIMIQMNIILHEILKIKICFNEIKKIFSELILPGYVYLAFRFESASCEGEGDAIQCSLFMSLTHFVSLKVSHKRLIELRGSEKIYMSESILEKS